GGDQATRGESRRSDRGTAPAVRGTDTRGRAGARVGAAGAGGLFQSRTGIERDAGRPGRPDPAGGDSSEFAGGCADYRAADGASSARAIQGDLADFHRDSTWGRRL